jgi:hypothetical protein
MGAKDPIKSLNKQQTDLIETFCQMDVIEAVANPDQLKNKTVLHYRFQQITLVHLQKMKET